MGLDDEMWKIRPEEYSKVFNVRQLVVSKRWGWLKRWFCKLHRHDWKDGRFCWRCGVWK